jgi:hypothetical protein
MMDGAAVRTAGKGALAVADGQERAIPVASVQIEALTPMLGLDGPAMLCLWYAALRRCSPRTRRPAAVTAADDAGSGSPICRPASAGRSCLASRDSR